MKIPNFENAVVPINKITKYLLSKTHSIGKNKAKFFLEVGFNYITLENVLMQHIQKNDIAYEIKTKYGVKYIVQGDIIAPNERKYNLCTIWIIETKKRIPYFITAYPIGKNV
jgi:hypothetical protein